MIEIGLPLAGSRKILEMKCAHRVGDEHSGEHELVARIGLELVHLGLQPHERRGVGGLVEQAHFVGDRVGEIGERVGDRRIDGELGEPFGGAVLAARLEQAFGEDVHVALALGALAGDEDLAMLLEVHQPIRHCQIVDVEEFAMALEGGRIFAVRIDHDDMALGAHVADPVHDEGGRGRFAGAGRAQQGEMLAEQGIDIERGAHVLGRIDRADLDMGAVVGGEHLLQILAGDRIGLAAGDGIAGDAALEIDQPAAGAVLVALAEEIDLGGDVAGLGVGDLERADVGEQPALARADLDLAADLAGHGDARIGIAGELGEAAADDLDRGAAAADLDDLADRLVPRHQRLARRRAEARGLGSVLARRKAVEVHGVGHAAGLETMSPQP